MATKQSYDKISRLSKTLYTKRNLKSSGFCKDIHMKIKLRQNFKIIFRIKPSLKCSGICKDILLKIKLR